MFPQGRQRTINCLDMSLFSQFEPLLPITDTYIDVVELFGGNAGVFKVVVTRGLAAGDNFDLVTGWNLLRTEHLAEFFRYPKRRKPNVVIMAPPCTLLNGLARLFGHNFKNSQRRCLQTLRLAWLSRRVADVHQAQGVGG